MRWYERPVVHVVAHVAVIAALLAIGGIVDHLVVWIVVWALLGPFIVGLASIAHYCTHRSLFRSQRANQNVGTVINLFTLMNYATDQAYHRQHHAATRIEGDTEVLAEGKNPITYAGLILFGTLGFLAENWWDSIRSAAGRPPSWVRSKRRIRQIRINLVLNVAAIAALATWIAVDARSAVYYYLLPLASGYVASTLLIIPEHFRCPSVDDLLVNTRSLYSGPVVEWVIWSENWHTAHHLAPNSPPWKLREATMALGDTIVHRSPGYLSFHAAIIKGFFHGNAGPVQAHTPSAA
jgi:fatty acid desaturase